SHRRPRCKDSWHFSVWGAWENLSPLLRLEELGNLDHAQDPGNVAQRRKESAKVRLRELEEVAYDMEDVVEYEYEVNRHKVEALERSYGVRNTGKQEYPEVNHLCYISTRGCCGHPTDPDEGVCPQAKDAAARLPTLFRPPSALGSRLGSRSMRTAAAGALGPPAATAASRRQRYWHA
uniref:Disease resistance N-terminal domain-containing protein n=1 Tax=Setaria italica TaxID=4555 RepID=K3ZMK6_SETIT